MRGNRNSKPRGSVQRPEGPTLNSHGRKAVAQVTLHTGSAEGAALQDLLPCHRCENSLMAGKYISLLVHFVWSTASREPWITSAWEGELYKVIGGILRKKNGKIYLIHGLTAVATQRRPFGPRGETTAAVICSSSFL